MADVSDAPASDGPASDGTASDGTASDATASDATASPGLLARWREVLRTSNPPAGRLDPVSKWLVLTPASVLPMTLTAGGAGRPPAGDPPRRPPRPLLLA